MWNCWREIDLCNLSRISTLTANLNIRTPSFITFSNYSNMFQCAKFRSGKVDYPPVKDQSWKAVPLVGLSLAWLADQNHPLTSLGEKSGRSHPSKLQRRPEVQMYFTPEKQNILMMDSFNNNLGIEYIIFDKKKHSALACRISFRYCSENYVRVSAGAPNAWKGGSQCIAMTAHFQVQTFEVRTPFQLVYRAH